MRTIKIQTNDGQLELQVQPTLAARVAIRNGIPENAVTDAMILSFFRDAANSAFSKSDDEYLDTDGTHT